MAASVLTYFFENENAKLGHTQTSIIQYSNGLLEKAAVCQDVVVSKLLQKQCARCATTRDSPIGSQQLSETITDFGALSRGTQDPHNEETAHRGLRTMRITESPRKNIFVMNRSLLTGFAFPVLPPFGTFGCPLHLCTSNNSRNSNAIQNLAIRGGKQRWVCFVQRTTCSLRNENWANYFKCYASKEGSHFSNNQRT